MPVIIERRNPSWAGNKSSVRAKYRPSKLDFTSSRRRAEHLSRQGVWVLICRLNDRLVDQRGRVSV
jgi:hypothetical protein